MNKSDLVSVCVSRFTVEQVDNLSDEEIVGLSIENPSHQGQYGFMLSPKYFKSTEHFAEILCALHHRLRVVKILNKG